MNFFSRSFLARSSLLVGVSTLSLQILNPQITFAASADDYHAACDNKDAKDHQTEYCTQAKVALNNKRAETVKTAIYGLAVAGVTTILATTPISLAAGTLCSRIDTGATLAGIGTDVVATLSNNSAVDQLFSTALTSYAKFKGASMVGEAATSATGVAAKAGLFKGLQKTAASGGAGAQAAKETLGCIAAEITTGIGLATSVFSLTSATSTFNTAVEHAQQQQTTVKNTVAYGVALKSSGYTNLNANGSAGAQATSDGAVVSCDSKSGSDYLTCVGKTPELAAITNNSDLMNSLQTSLGAKPLGDFLKNATATTVGDAVSAGISAIGSSSGEMASKLASGIDQATKDTGVIDKYTPLTYARSGTKASVGGGDDFGKMMSDMLAKLNPEAAKDQKGGDPSDLVFRQLDLLPPEKVEASKEISLFARIGYRYRKNLPNVDELHWAAPSNQANAR